MVDDSWSSLKTAWLAAFACDRAAMDDCCRMCALAGFAAWASHRKACRIVGTAVDAIARRQPLNRLALKRAVDVQILRSYQRIGVGLKRDHGLPARPPAFFDPHHPYRTCSPELEILRGFTELEDQSDRQPPRAGHPETSGPADVRAAHVPVCLVKNRPLPLHSPPTCTRSTPFCIH